MTEPLHPGAPRRRRFTPAEAPAGVRPEARPTLDGAATAEDQARAGLLRDRVFQAMRAGAWWSVPALTRHLGHGSESSVGARMRDLRKDRYGGHTLDRRLTDRRQGLYEFRLVERRSGDDRRGAPAGEGGADGQA